MKKEVIESKLNDIESQIKEIREAIKEQPEFKAGEWAAWQNKGAKKRLFKIDRFLSYDVYGDDMEGGGVALQCDISDLLSVTKEEIESHLIGIAKEKGFAPHSAATLNSSTIYPDWNKYHIVFLGEFNYQPISDSLVSGSITIYSSGKWAEIIPSKKAVPKTKEEFYSFVNDVIRWTDDDNHPIRTQEDFLNQYDF